MNKRWFPNLDREAMLSRVPKQAVLAELGVFRGDFAKRLFDICEPRELHLVDLFKGAAFCGDEDGANVIRTEDLTQEYSALVSYFNGSKEVHIKCGASKDVLSGYPDNYFDFIYIDADHSYHGVSQDLELARQKVKPNGFISGHDYQPEDFPGVCRAVDEFANAFGLDLLIFNNRRLASYWLENLK